jgi:glycerol-3-phosphate dehydrogenase
LPALRGRQRCALPLGDVSNPATAANPSALDRRRAALERLAGERWEVLIVGGGIVGAGALLDATSRGLRVALVEQDDIASGTSSRSSRLIHGGLRYLEHYQFSVVVESLAERARLVRLAPHLVRLNEFLFPLRGLPGGSRLFYGSGMLLYDLLGSARSGGFHRHLRVGSTLDYAPQLRRSGLRGGLVYHDAVADDARLALAVTRTALDQGAIAVTRIRATGPLHVGTAIDGVHALDLVSGAELDIRADRVVDATGVWASRPDRPFADSSLAIVPSRGSHILVPRDRLPVRGGITLRVPGRVVFMVPWPRHWIIGTTDAPYHGSVEHPRASADEVDSIIDTVNRAMDVDLSRDDVVGTYAGFRPLVAPSASGSTVAVSRHHRVARDPDGLVRVSGGKYTTYRVMARDAIDAALSGGDGQSKESKRRPSATADLPLRGGVPLTDIPAAASAIAHDHGITPDAATSLVDRHGTDAARVAELGAELEMLTPLAAGFPYLEAEVAWAVRHELALGLDDVLARRLRLVHELPDRGAAIAPRVAAIVGSELGWDERRQAIETDRFLATARTEFGLPAAARTASADKRSGLRLVDPTGIDGTEAA